MSLITENDLDTVRNALRRCKELTLERTLAERKVRLSVVSASPVWHVAMLVRVERWWPGWYASKYCASVEEVKKYLAERQCFSG